MKTKDTQSFNTPKGLIKCRDNFLQFRKCLRSNCDNRIAGYYYDKAYKASLFFPPCSVVSSLKNDFITYQTQNILNDLDVIKADRDKIKY